MSAPIAVARVGETKLLTARQAKDLAFLSRYSANHRAGLAASEPIGRCKGRGTRMGGRHIVGGKTHVIPAACDRRHVPQIAPGAIVVAAMIYPEWISALTEAGGLVIDQIARNDDVQAFALRYLVPSIVNIPNAGQFVDGEFIYLHGDGRVIAPLVEQCAPG